MFTTLMFVALAGPAADPPELTEAGKKELKKFEGKWKAEKVIVAGLEVVPGANEGTIEFKGQKMIVDGFELAEVSALDPGVDPKCLDFKAVIEKGEIAKGMVYETIYKIDGDTLTWAIYIGADKKRPANFDAPTEKDAGMVLATFKRVKE